MAFIKFTEGGRSYAAKASLSKSGMLSISDGARRRFHLDDFGFCVLYYDPDTNRIGVELTANKESDGARRIRFRPTGADVAAKSFVDFFGIDARETKTYQVEQDEESGMLTIDLNQGKTRNSSQT
jgi:hypothetical protein